jgi:hypothetical protein
MSNPEMKDSRPVIITCQPDDQYFIWQNHLYVESCLEQGFQEEQIHILLYKPKNRKYNENWEKLKTIYSKLNIFMYEDDGVQAFLPVYIPILRPHLLWQHFKRFPELEKKTIIYTDCDILWLKGLDIEKFYDDDNCYISNAESYMNHSYFESKKRDILEEKKEEASTRDFLKEICDIVGIPKEIVIENNNNTGGVQYILKNMTSAFWKKVEVDTLNIRTHLLAVNKMFYKDENSGIQSWCADLWAVLFNLWYHNKNVKVVPEMEFAWSTDSIEKINKCGILHNAGIVGTMQGTWPAFYKGKYHNGGDPTNDVHLNTVLTNEETKKHCNWYYANKLRQLKLKYNLNY